MNKSIEAQGETLYDSAFYARQSDRSYQSADSIIPLVLSFVPAKSAIDVGCGVGTWASKLLECGVQDVLGIDGDYVNQELLRIPKSCFQAWNLSEPVKIDKKFDLAICLEVAEHLPSTRAESLVGDLVTFAPAVLFSAAIPGQGGVNHINEQYLSYWADLFTRRDYVLLDIIRPAVWSDERCDWWYRQNSVLFVHKDNPLSRLRVASGVDYIHPHLYKRTHEIADALRKPTLGFLLRAFPDSFLRSLHARLTRFTHSRSHP